MFVITFFSSSLRFFVSASYTTNEMNKNTHALSQHKLHQKNNNNNKNDTEHKTNPEIYCLSLYL